MTGKCRDGDKGRRFYQSKEWRAFRNKAVKLPRPQGCARCGYPFEPDEKHLQLDHSEDLKAAWHRRFDPTNAQLMHVGYHNKKTHHPGHRKPVGNDGYPDDWR